MGLVLLPHQSLLILIVLVFVGFWRNPGSLGLSLTRWTQTWGTMWIAKTCGGCGAA